MDRIEISADRQSVTVFEGGAPCKGCLGSEDFCEAQAQRWAKQYNIEFIDYESSKINQPKG